MFVKCLVHLGTFLAILVGERDACHMSYAIVFIKSLWQPYRSIQEQAIIS